MPKKSLNNCLKQKIISGTLAGKDDSQDHGAQREDFVIIVLRYCMNLSNISYLPFFCIGPSIRNREYSLLLEKPPTVNKNNDPP